MKNKLLLCLTLCLSLGLVSCGKTTSVSDTDNASEASVVEESSVSEAIIDDPVIEETTDELTEADLDKITEFIQKPYNYGFLMSTYTDVREVDFRPIFYNGDVYKDIPDEEFEDLWKPFEGTEGGSLTVISSDEILRIMTELTGLNSLDDFYNFYNFYDDNWRYSDNYKSYYRCVGDINYRQFEVTRGFMVDDLIIINAQETDMTSIYAGQGYQNTRYEVALKPVGDSYQFVSCRQLYDDNLITESCFELTLSNIGKSLFFTYEPVMEYGDVTFKVINNGEVVQTLYSGHETNSAGDYYIFDDIEEMGFCDFNNDGYPDMICIANYTNYANGEPVKIEKVYSGSEDGAFYYSYGLNEFVNSEREIKDLASEIEFLKDQNMYNPDWKTVYINLIDSLSEDELGVVGTGGFSVINVDSDPIPEIAVYGNCEASGSKLITYAEGKGQYTYFNRLYFSYMPETGYINNSEGLMGYYYDIIYKMDNTYLVPVAVGTYEDDYAYINDYGELEGDFSYAWNGTEVSEGEYYEALYDVYDSRNYYTKSVRWDQILDYEELISMLNCEYTKFF